jgi:hypothetical protein
MNTGSGEFVISLPEEAVGALVVGDLVVGDRVVGALICVGDLVVGDLVVGDLVVGDLVVGDLAEVTDPDELNMVGNSKHVRIKIISHAWNVHIFFLIQRNCRNPRSSH